MEKLLPIYRSEQAARERYGNYYYYTSQLHICIEMAFGLMIKRWSILQRPITISIHNTKRLICSIGVLHNYYINEQIVHCGGNGIFVQKTLTFLQKRWYCKTLLSNLTEIIWYLILLCHILIRERMCCNRIGHIWIYKERWCGGLKLLFCIV